MPLKTKATHRMRMRMRKRKRLIVGNECGRQNKITPGQERPGVIPLVRLRDQGPEAGAQVAGM